MPGVDRIAQRRIGKPAIGADIAHRGEPGLQRDAGIARADQRGGGGRSPDRRVQFGALPRVGQMCMQVDQAGQDGECRPVDPFGPIGRLAARLDPGYALAVGQQALATRQRTGFDVEQLARLDIERTGPRRTGKRKRTGSNGQRQPCHRDVSSFSSAW